MLFEFIQINAIGNGSQTLYFVLQNPRVENGMNVAEMVGTLAGFSNGGRDYH